MYKAVLKTLLLLFILLVFISACENQNLDSSSLGNIVNEGLATSIGKNIYFTDVDGIYRTNASNEVKKLYTDIQRVNYLSVYNDELYFIDLASPTLYKMDLDGSEKQKVLDYCYSYVIEGDYIYYIRSDKEVMYLRQLYRSKIDGSDSKKLCDASVINEFTIYNGQIYYIIDYDDPMEPFGTGRRIYKMDIDGSNNMLLSDNQSKSINIYDGWIYFVNYDDEKRIYRIRFDGSSKTKLNNVSAWDLNVYDGWVYFTHFNDMKAYKFSLDNWSNIIKLDKVESYELNIVNGWLYYINGADHNEYGYGYTYKAKLDGTDNQRVAKDIEE